LYSASTSVSNARIYTGGPVNISQHVEEQYSINQGAQYSYPHAAILQRTERPYVRVETFNSTPVRHTGHYQVNFVIF